MTGAEKGKIWMVLDHPMQFAVAMGVASYWKQQRYAINLLVSPHPYWGKVDINRYKAHFNDVFFMERPDYTWHPLSVIRTIYQIWRLKRRLARLNIGQNDVIVGLSIFHYLENIVLSMHPENFKIAIMPAVVYEECTRELDNDAYYTPPEGWIAGVLIEPVMGLYRTYCKKERLHPDTYWRLRYRKSLLEIYDRVVVMGDVSSDKNPDAERICAMPYPYVLTLSEEKLKETAIPTRKKVVFFGDSFRAGIWGLKPDIYSRYLNQCLSFLRTKYGDTYQLVYRPHPAESDEEAKYLDLKDFIIEKNTMLSELYFYENHSSIEAVFSVASTSSRSAYHFFINAYSFLDIFPFDSTAGNYFRAEMGNVPEEFYISDLTSTPLRYINAASIKSVIYSCRNTLDMVLHKQQ